LKRTLDKWGWTHTYDWTVHGSVQQEPSKRIGQVAEAEMGGVVAAQILIALLPGGRGTHCEIGAALAVGSKVFICSEDPELDFGTTGKTCAFYHHPGVVQCNSYTDLTLALLKETE
jgi:hypothetical protein